MQLTRQCEGTLARLRGESTARLRVVQHYFDRRQLEAHLATLVDAATGHEAQGLAPGAPLYLVLYRESELLVSAYCNRWQGSVERLKAEIPALGKLHKLASASPRQTRAGISIVILAAGMLLAFLAGVAAGLLRFGYHLVGGGR
jgi:hypothetical protein